jgi:hypothetical protein
MKNTVFKLMVIFLFLVQAAALSFFFYLFRSFLSMGGQYPEFLFNELIIYILLALVIIISAFYTGIIILRPARIVYLPSPEILQPLKETIDSKPKQEQDAKKIKEQNEKKRLMLNEMMKGLDITLNSENYANQVLINISKQIDIFQGIFFLRSNVDGVFRKAGTYAYYSEDEFPEFHEGVGLTGQVATNKKLLNVVNIPEKYLTVLSGLGKSSPGNLLIFPVIHNQITIGIVELASFIKFDGFVEQILTDFAGLISKHLAEINTPAPSLSDKEGKV